VSTRPSRVRDSFWCRRGRPTRVDRARDVACHANNLKLLNFETDRDPPPRAETGRARPPRVLRKSSTCAGGCSTLRRQCCRSIRGRPTPASARRALTARPRRMGSETWSVVHSGARSSSYALAPSSESSRVRCVRQLWRISHVKSFCASARRRATRSRRRRPSRGRFRSRRWCARSPIHAWRSPHPSRRDCTDCTDFVIPSTRERCPWRARSWDETREANAVLPASPSSPAYKRRFPRRFPRAAKTRIRARWGDARTRTSRPPSRLSRGSTLRRDWPRPYRNRVDRAKRAIGRDRRT